MIRYTFLRFPGGKGKAVTFSYDDGNRADIKFANIIDRYGLKSTFNICSKAFKTNGLTDDEIRENIISKGHEIALHGAKHRAPGKHRPIEIIRDILDLRIELEERFDMIIKGMAYPDSGIKQISGQNTFDNIKQYLSMQPIWKFTITFRPIIHYHTVLMLPVYTIQHFRLYGLK